MKNETIPEKKTIRKAGEAQTPDFPSSPGFPPGCRENPGHGQSRR
jgi:hypothetical protein